jgi:cell wall-associated NlpC family hydrolase
MTRRPLWHSATLLAILAVVGGVTLPSAAADPLSSAKTQAAALTKTVATLQLRAEVATEQYDGIEAALGKAVGNQVSASRALQQRQAAAAAAQQTVDDRARALYETGGGSALLGALISGTSPSNALQRYTLASSVLSYESNSAVAASRAAKQASARETRDTAATDTVTRLQAAASRQAAAVQALLRANRVALRSANQTVKRIMVADAAAAAAAQARDFTSALNAAGGTLNSKDSTTPPNQIAATAIAAARSRLGVPYVWGATGPDAFDCSGLTQWSYAHAGIQLPRVAAQQWNSGPHPSLADLEPGDLLFWALNIHDPATIHHVALYIGHGMMIAAPHTGENVQIQPVYMQGFIGATRPWAKTTTPAGT